MDFAPRDNFSVIDAVKLHAIISCVGLFGSPKINRASVQAEGSSSSGDSSPGVPPTPVVAPAGAAAAFNLDACFRMGEGR